jgi:methionine-rich copper-binding protein CopC
MTCYDAALYVTSTGGVTSAHFFRATTLTLTGTGVITTLYGLRLPDLGDATLVTTSYGIYIASQTPSATASYAIYTGTGQLRFGDKITTYNAIATVGDGVGYEVALSDLTAQGAAIGATTIYAVPASGAGMYRVSWVATVTRAATTSCVLGGSTGFTLKYTDADDSVVKTENPTTPTISAINATGTSISGVEMAYCKASTNLQYLFGYTSVGATTMQYNLHIRVEKL